MRKILFIGDPHVVVEELSDCERLIDLVCEVLASNPIDEVVLLGDLYNNHNVMRVEVMDFWRKSIDRLRTRIRRNDIVALVGNHDFAGEGATAHALMAHSEALYVLERPEVQNSVLYLPYMSRPEEFVTACNERPTTTVICHQTFNGAKYENGFYAPDGVDPDAIPQQYVISGHIHTPQSIGKVRYVGAPRWRSISDANIDRQLNVFTFDETGTPVDVQQFATATHCRMIRTANDTAEQPFDLEQLSATATVDWRVDVYGHSEHVKERACILQRAGVKVRAFPDRENVVSVKESEGIPQSFEKFSNDFVPKNGTPLTELQKLARERLYA